MKLLTNTIHDYLELYDVEVKKELIDSKDVLIDLKEKMHGKLEGSNATIRFDDLPQLLADPALFLRLVTNIIDNSIKFKTPDTDPAIDISYSLITDLNTDQRAKTNTAYSVITVTDNGIGFNQEDADKAFELFTQLGTKHKGSGIGLAICKKIMEMHGGFITAESAAGKGTSVHCYFPL